MTTHDITVQERSDDLQSLNRNHYSLQVAKSASAPGGSPVFNIVYMSKHLAPNMSVSWKEQYGLNWSETVPDPGAEVVYSGNWQTCNSGQSYDLDANGEWVFNGNNPHANAASLNVGVNNYRAVHVIVGIQDSSTKTWMPIYIDGDELLKGGFGKYEPRESVQIWYQENNRTSTMITDQELPVQLFDMTGIDKHYFRYSTETGTWSDQPTPYPPGQYGNDLPPRKDNRPT
ncbi:hypothetical protein DL770_004181 [Monosporascus sp. CRB-9-2]|nr:hypothetical protein DL770_004181 [Monosporascus sp. CRB-9-2]